MAMGSGSKRGRSSESPPLSPARGATRRRIENRSFERRRTEMEEASPPAAAAAEVNKNNNDRVVVHDEDARGGSIMTLGSDAKASADRCIQLPRFGEFLKVCGWCNKDIVNGATAYMFGNFNAFCKPECQEKAIRKLYDGHLVESGLPKHPKFGC